jgi:hypothetical protein
VHGSTQDVGHGDDQIKGVIDLYDMDSCFQTGPKQDKIILKLRGISLTFKADSKANAKEWIQNFQLVMQDRVSLQQ